MSATGFDLSLLTAVIKTFHRPRALKRLINSIRRFYPQLAIAVADDGIEATPADELGENVSYLRLPTDVGLSAGRNALLRHIETPYFLLLDDDLEFDANTRIEKLFDLVERDEVDLAAGDYDACKRKLVYTRRRWQPYHGMLQREGDTLSLLPQVLSNHGEYQRCEIVHNFFVARTEQVLAAGGWDEALKLHEHTEFFYRLSQQDWRVAYVPSVVAKHWREKSESYSPYRNRDFRALGRERMGITHEVDTLHDGWTKEPRQRAA